MSTKSATAKEKHLVNPTVLVVEDDLATLTNIARKFTTNTALGILAVTNLRDAAAYLTPKQISRYHLKSVFADEEFAPEAQSDQPKLESGLDLLELAHSKQPQMSLYLNTVHGQDAKTLKRAKKTMGTTSRVFSKGEPRALGQEPWNCVWRDYLVEALRTEPDLQNALEHDKVNALDARERYMTGETAMADQLRNLFDAHRITYLFAMGPLGVSHKLHFKKPVEAVCIRGGNGQYTARALGLGLIKESLECADPWDAQEDLADNIISLYLELSDTKPEQLGAFATKVLANVRSVIDDSQFSGDPRV